MTAPPSSFRKPVAAIAILLLIAIWALLIASASHLVGKWPVLIQALFYLFMGIIWIIPLKPLLRWSETGSWKALSNEAAAHQDGTGPERDKLN